MKDTNARNAVYHLIEKLVQRRGLTRTEAQEILDYLNKPDVEPEKPQVNEKAKS